MTSIARVLFRADVINTARQISSGGILRVTGAKCYDEGISLFRSVLQGAGEVRLFD